MSGVGHESRDFFQESEFLKIVGSDANIPSTPSTSFSFPSLSNGIPSLVALICAIFFVAGFIVFSKRQLVRRTTIPGEVQGEVLLMQNVVQRSGNSSVRNTGLDEEQEQTTFTSSAFSKTRN
jgi:hypothetical protein